MEVRLARGMFFAPAQAEGPKVESNGAAEASDSASESTIPKVWG